jgi:predicted nucleic-acid-binding Zn-ribbon protein
MCSGWKVFSDMIKCSKCKGRVFVDRVFSQKSHIELFCIMCGKRWMMNKNTSRLGAWLEKLEEDQARKYATFS